MRSILAAGLVFGLLGSPSAKLRAETVEVIGKSGGPLGHRWEDKEGKASPKAATLGKPEGRLRIKVKNGDVVRFKVESGMHGVILESAKSEMDAGVWEVASGTLMELPAAWKNFGKGARMTAKMGADKVLLEIKIKGLKAGSGILYACNPHSTGKDPTKQPMLGIIILDGAKR